MAAVGASMTTNGLPVALCFRSRKKAELCSQFIKQQFPDARVELFTGKSHDSQIRQFANISDFMEKKKKASCCNSDIRSDSWERHTPRFLLGLC